MIAKQRKQKGPQKSHLYNIDIDCDDYTADRLREIYVLTQVEDMPQLRLRTSTGR